MGILGHPTTGWFARLANGVESGGRWVGNLVTGGSGGDRFYDNMGHHANTYVENVNNQVIAQATANGATPQQALQAGSAAMESLANPGSVGEVVELGGAGVQVATTTVAETAVDAASQLMESVAPAAPDFAAPPPVASPDMAAVEMPVAAPDLGGLVVAGLALGGTLLASVAFGGSPSSSPAPNRRQGQEAAYA